MSSEARRLTTFGYFVFSDREKRQFEANGFIVNYKYSMMVFQRNYHSAVACLPLAGSVLLIQFVIDEDFTLSVEYRKVIDPDPEKTFPTKETFNLSPTADPDLSQVFEVAYNEYSKAKVV